MIRKTGNGYADDSTAATASDTEAGAQPSARPPAAAAPSDAPTPCGEHGCLLYESPAAAFAAVLAEAPVVLAVGEMHALEGSKAVASATRRFTEELLPMLRGRASDLVLELWVSDPGCVRAVAKVERSQGEIRKGQAASNQDEHVALGDESKRLGIQPHVLEPTCEDYEQIAAAGEDDVILMLETIARLTTEKVAGLVEKNRVRDTDQAVVCYGGAIHNDLEPAKGAASFSFGRALAERVAGRYVALDLVVPELVRDTKLWRSQPWHDHYDPDAHPGRTVLYHPRPGEYTLIFPRGDSRP